ncbi:MAG: hypothetical protein ACI8TL_001016, partial [Natronomonas sp.]
SYRLFIIMSNYLSVRTLRTTVMAASNQTVGFDHLTVVPENFEPSDGTQREDEAPDRTDRE